MLDTVIPVIEKHWTAYQEFFAKTGYKLGDFNRNANIYSPDAKAISLYLWLRCPDPSAAVDGNHIITGDREATERGIIFQKILIDLRTDLVAVGFLGEVYPFVFPFIDTVFARSGLKPREFANKDEEYAVNEAMRLLDDTVNPNQIPATWMILQDRVVYFADFPVNLCKIPTDSAYYDKFMDDHPQFVKAMLDARIRRVEMAHTQFDRMANRVMAKQPHIHINEYRDTKFTRLHKAASVRLDLELLNKGRFFQQDPYCARLLAFVTKCRYNNPLREALTTTPIDDDFAFLQQLPSVLFKTATPKDMSRWYNAHIQRVNREALTALFEKLDSQLKSAQHHDGQDVIFRGILSAWNTWATSPEVLRRVRFLKLLRRFLTIMTNDKLGGYSALSYRVVRMNNTMLEALSGKFVTSDLGEDGPLTQDF